MKRLIAVFLIVSLVSGCNRIADNVISTPQSLNASALVPQSQNGTESSQFSPIPAESVEPLKLPNKNKQTEAQRPSHENARWYVKAKDWAYKNRENIYIALAVTATALLIWLGVHEHKRAEMLAKKLKTANDELKMHGVSQDSESVKELVDIEMHASSAIEGLVNTCEQMDSRIGQLNDQIKVWKDENALLKQSAKGEDLGLIKENTSIKQSFIVQGNVLSKAQEDLLKIKAENQAILEQYKELFDQKQSENEELCKELEQTKIKARAMLDSQRQLIEEMQPVYNKYLPLLDIFNDMSATLEQTQRQVFDLTTELEQLKKAYQELSQHYTASYYEH
jgi:DNA repair exonuclease SbcCD ATPase subunit